MLSRRTRTYISFVLDPKAHQKMIDWKIASRRRVQTVMKDLYREMINAITQYFAGFDFMTVPAPSFHTYDNYPIWEVAKRISADIGIPLEKLFPNKSGKTKMMAFGSIEKQVQAIECAPGKFVLILDDIYTTGHTMRVTCEAIILRGSFPCSLAFA